MSNHYLDEIDFLERWGCSFISRTDDPFSYVARFPCPECGSDAFEIFLEMTDLSKEMAPKLSLGEYELWVIRWTSACGHVSGGIDESACVATPIAENGRIVGVIEPVSPPPWCRYEKEGARGACVDFATRWQAEHASDAEFRMLAALRRDEPEVFEVTSK